MRKRNEELTGKRAQLIRKKKYLCRLTISKSTTPSKEAQEQPSALKAKSKEVNIKE